MIKKLTPIGNSHGIIIDRPILELLNITQDTELEITTDGDRLIIAPLGKGKKKGRRRPHVPVLPSAPQEPLEPRIGFPKKQPW